MLTDRCVVDISAAVKKPYTPQLTMQGIIDEFEALRPALEKLAGESTALPPDQVRLRPPLLRPGKILACIANSWEHAQRVADHEGKTRRSPKVECAERACHYRK